MKKDLKATKILGINKVVKPEQAISWVIYDGDNILDAERVEQYAKGFLMSGNLMPIPGRELKLDVISVAKEFDNGNNTHKVTVEGIFKKDQSAT